MFANFLEANLDRQTGNECRDKHAGTNGFGEHQAEYRQTEYADLLECFRCPFLFGSQPLTGNPRQAQFPHQGAAAQSRAALLEPRQACIVTCNTAGLKP